jgi:ATP adenylyltransferase
VGDVLEPAGGLPGDPDGLERLWTPHRMAYVTGEHPESREGPSGCPLCRAGTADDDDALVVARGEVTFALLNLYPYNSGHLMLLPYRHVADYTDLSADETVELAEMTQTAIRVLRAVLSPHGFNLGINQGAVAGAGIAGHIHQHVVPRWGGDSNFLPIVARTKALPELLGRTRQRLADAWPAPRG